MSFLAGGFCFRETLRKPSPGQRHTPLAHVPARVCSGWYNRATGHLASDLGRRFSPTHLRRLRWFSLPFWPAGSGPTVSDLSPGRRKHAMLVFEKQTLDGSTYYY